ncbi:857_t:CDS:1, partial [Entrophospora sp. SA101]
MSQQSSSSKKRVYITAVQKRELCMLKKSKPEPRNIELANQFGISTSQ